MLLLESYEVTDKGTFEVTMSSCAYEKLGVWVTSDEIHLCNYDSGEVHTISKLKRPHTDYMLNQSGYTLTTDEFRDLRNLLRVAYDPKFLEILNRYSNKRVLFGTNLLFKALRKATIVGVESYFDRI